MKCAHCCYSCTAKGEDMAFKTFKTAVDISSDFGEGVSLGGGEPTLHPEFWQFLGYALSKDDGEAHLWLATNGKRKADAIALARLAQTGAFGVALSQDEWHEPIDPAVVRAFTRTQNHSYPDPHPNDFREIRTVREPFKAGRCRVGPRRCVCPELVVNPDGAVLQCGCTDSPKLGHIRGGVKGEWITHECWHEEEPRT